MAEKKMTLKRFLKQLKKVRYEWGVFNWQVRLPSYCDGHSPITAVCNMMTGEVYMPEDWKEAAFSLNLPIELAQKISNASDGIDGHDKKIRRRILKATQLMK